MREFILYRVVLVSGVIDKGFWIQYALCNW